MNEIMRSQLLLQLILEDFDIDETEMQIDQILLNEDESPIDIINVDLNNKDNNDNIIKKSDQESDEIQDLLGIDDLVDKLEDEKDDDIEVDLNKTDTLHLNISQNDSGEDDDMEDNSSEVILNTIIKNMNDNNIKVNINNDNEKNNSNDIKVNIKNDNGDLPGADIQLKLKNNKSSSSSRDENDIIVKLKDIKNNKDEESADIKINLTNTENNSSETKTSIFIKKRDELIQSDDPNMQLSVCLKIIVDLKKSLDRLINFVPDEIILVRTKYLLGDALNEILESSDLILKDPKKIKDIIYKVFDMIVSVNEYIESKYIQLEDKLDNQTKDQENKEISKQLNDAEDQQNNDTNNNKLINDDNNGATKKRPNINRQKM